MKFFAISKFQYLSLHYFLSFYSISAPILVACIKPLISENEFKVRSLVPNTFEIEIIIIKSVIITTVKTIIKSLYSNNYNIAENTHTTRVILTTIYCSGQDFFFVKKMLQKLTRISLYIL